MDHTPPFPPHEAQPDTVSASGFLETAKAEVSAVLPVALRNALALSLELSSQVVNNLVGRALLSLDRQATASADPQQRQQLDSCSSELEKLRGGWVQQYPALLRIACAHPNAQARASISRADLRICALDLQRIEQSVLALGGQVNPLAAHSHVQALLELVSRSPVQEVCKQIWLDQLLPALGSQLAWVSLQLIAMLKDPASRETPVAATDAGFEEWAASAYGLHRDMSQLGTTADRDVQFTPEMRQVAGDARRTVMRLRKALGEPDTLPSEIGPAGYSEMDRTLRDLDEAERLMALMHQRGLQLQENEDGDSDLQVNPAAARNYAEQISELIKLYQDTTSPSLARVPYPLREALTRFQAPLEKLAVLDASVLTDVQHPARQLLYSATQRSLQFATEMSEGFPAFIGPVNKVIETLAQQPQPSAKMYEKALQSLAALWARQDAEKNALIEQQAQQLEMLEQRKQLAGRLAFELVSRRDAGDTPVQIKQLLMGAWAQVLARAHLSPQYPQDPSYFAQVTSALLWSVSTRRAGARKQQLQVLLPKIVQAVTEGLQSIDHPHVQTEEVMKDLAKLHADVMASANPPDVAAGDDAPFIPERV